MTTALFFAMYFFLAASCVSAQQEDGLPLRLQQSPVQGDQACPSAENLDPIRNAVDTSLNETIIPAIAARPQCPCGGAGSWRRIAHLNMSDPNQQCPPNWRLLTTPVRACGAATGSSCASAVFPSNGQSYSRVCGRVIGYQKGSTDAFFPSVDGRSPGLEGVYIEGVSLTHGPAGSRQHIWSFVAALYETDPNYAIAPFYVCPCTNTDFTWPFQVPSFIGSNYFCDTGNPGPGFTLTSVHTDDPLWDGTGCGPTNACCRLHTPPWFCATLPQATTDDIELRICNDQPFSDEDVLVKLVNIYVM